MAVTFDAEDSASDAGGSVTVTLTIASNSSSLTSVTAQGSTTNITDMTQDSIAMTFVHEIQANSRTTQQYNEETPVTGVSKAYFCDTDGTSMVHLHVLSVLGADTLDMIGENSVSSGSSSNPNDSGTLEQSSTYTYEHFFFNSVATTIDSANDGQTQRSDLIASYSSFTYTNEGLASGSYTPDYTLSDSKNWNFAWVEVRAASKTIYFHLKNLGGY